MLGVDLLRRHPPLERVRPGSIILLHGMHAGREQTRLAVGPIIDRLEAEDYRCVTVSELLTHEVR